MTTLADTSTAASLDPDGTAVLDRLFRGRRTARALADRPVPDDVVEAVHDAVRWGPTAFNASPLRLLLVRSDPAREVLADHMSRGNRDRVLAAPLAVVLAADTDFHDTLDVLAPSVDRERFAADPVGRAALARDNAWLQAGYLIVGLRAAGLDVGPMSGMDAAGIDAALLAGTAWRSLMVVTVGHPIGDGAARPRAPRPEFEDVARTV